MSDPILLTIHTDGASRGNPGPAAYAYVIERAGEPDIEEAGKIGRMTNNQAEYTALVRALERALALGPAHKVELYSDSELMVKQMRGEYKVKNGDLKPLFEEGRRLADRFSHGVAFHHIPREQNGRADALGNQALDGKREPMPFAGAGKNHQPQLREEALACLGLALANGSEPDKVWAQLVELMKRHGVKIPLGSG
jgi:ribonuclease HI